MLIEDKMRAADYRPTGFDYLRIILACSVIGWHSIVTSYGNEVQDAVQASPWRSVFALILPMFFVLSGFLVAGSLDRCRTMVSFLGLRFLRIYPALTVEVLLSAFILGPLLTSVPLSEYFTDTKFFEYLWNILGHIHYELPGVFETNPHPERVNGQLWTVPFELYCYLLIVILFLVGLTRRTSIFVLTVVGLGLFVTAGLVAKAYLNGAGQPANMSGYLLIICFLTGIAFYKLRAHILWDSRLAIGALLASLLLLQLPVVGDALSIVPIGYLTVFLGVMNMRKIGLLKGADYSYGVFLYGYVIQQAYMTLGPAFHHWYINIALSLPTAALFAAFSWHLVEKPALKGRRPLIALEDRWIAYRARMKKLPEPEGTI